MHAGSCHIPVQQFASSLQSDLSTFEEAHHCPRPAHDDVLVLQSRVQSRAAWAARLAQDLGFVHCLVYKQVNEHSFPVSRLALVMSGNCACFLF